jgi:hypothetical protein
LLNSLRRSTRGGENKLAVTYTEEKLTKKRESKESSKINSRKLTGSVIEGESASREGNGMVEEQKSE